MIQQNYTPLDLQEILTGMSEHVGRNDCPDSNGCKQGFTRGRTAPMIEFYLNKLACSLEGQLETDVELFLEQVCIDEHEFQQNSSFLDKGWVSVCFSVFSNTLELLLPLELVQDISENVLKKNSDILLTPPKDEELTAVSFVAAKTIAEEKIFAHQRIYLTSVDSVTDSVERDRAQKCLSRKLAEQGSLVLLLQSKLCKSSCKLAVVLDAPLIKRIEYYAKLFISSVEQCKALNLAKTRWKVEMFFPMLTILLALELKPGDIISLRNNAEFTARVLLSQIVGEGKRSAKPYGHKNGVSAKLELLPESTPGLLQLKLRV